jgi:hypothetical protein
MDIIENGNRRTIINVTPAEQEVFKFFSKHSPCWFEGCNELRASFALEESELPKDCPACHRGALIRKYLPKVKELLASHNMKSYKKVGVKPKDPVELQSVTSTAADVKISGLEPIKAETAGTSVSEGVVVDVIKPTWVDKLFKHLKGVI